MSIEPYLLFLAMLVYLVTVYWFWRGDQLVGAYKWFFSLAFLPVFLFLMFANIWIADHAFPNIIEWNESLSRRGGGLIAFLITALIPVSVCWLWYVLFACLSHRHRRPAL